MQVSRAMVVSMTQLGTYDQAKTMLTPILGDNKGTHLASAVTAAVVYSFASLPLVSVNHRDVTSTSRTPRPRWFSVAWHVKPRIIACCICLFLFDASPIESVRYIFGLLW